MITLLIRKYNVLLLLTSVMISVNNCDRDCYYCSICYKNVGFCIAAVESECQKQLHQQFRSRWRAAVEYTYY